MGFFDDVTSIVINNKEVQSIITSDGGIIYEKPIGYELVLTSDKSIIQTGESATLSATLTNNNVPMANQTIVFNGLEYTETLEANIEITVGDTYRFTSIPSSLSSSDRIYLNEEQTIYITSDGMGNKKLVINGEAPYGQQYLDFFYVENGIIYYQRINDALRYYDASSTNTNKITSTVSNVVIEEYAKAVTDANGVASVTYTGKGVGDINVQADYEGIIQSEVFVIEDCIKYFSEQITNQILNLNVVDMPLNFKITYDVYHAPTTTRYGAYIQVGEENSAILVGQYSLSQYAIFDWNFGGNPSTIQKSLKTGSYYPVELTYNNGVWNAQIDTDWTITRNEVYTHRDYVGVRTEQYGFIKNIKIKPL